MSSRLVVPLVCTAAIVFACGPRSHVGTSSRAPAANGLRVAALDGTRRATSAKRPAKRHRGDTTAVDASFEVRTGARDVRLELQIVNVTTHRLEIDFPDGKTRDFYVVDDSGTEVWRWSRGRLFTQTVQNKFLGGGDTTVYREQWKGAKPGAYTAVAVLRSRNYPVEKRVSFLVGAPSVAVAAADER